MLFEKVEREKLPVAKNILTKVKLSDAIDDVDFYNLTYQGVLACVGGIEEYEDKGVLRSVVVIDNCRKKGLGKYTVDCLESVAREKGIQDLYVITEQAEGFFEKLGYSKEDRQMAPNKIKASSEFDSKKDTATFMHKRL